MRRQELVYVGVYKICCGITILLGMWIAEVEARKPYQAEVSVANQSTTFKATNPVTLQKELSTDSIQRRIDIYNSTSAASFNLNLRGLLGNGFFPLGSTAFTVQIPQIGVTQTFQGATREDSMKLFVEFLRDSGSRNTLQAYAKYTPIDPIAGNPNSLMSLMGQADYALGRLSPLAGCDDCWSAQPIVHQFQAGLNAGRAFAGGFDTTILTVPLRYSYSPDGDWAFILDAPLTAIINGGAYTYDLSVGTGVRFPILKEWSLTPILRFGAGATFDLFTLSDFVSLGVTSEIDYPVGDYVLSITNYVGYITSTGLNWGGVNWDYGLHNWMFKNGLMLTSCHLYEYCGRPLNFSLAFTDSDFEGSSLFISHYDEVGFSLIANNVNPYIDYDVLSVGFSFQFGQEEYKGYFLNTSYQF